MILKIVVLESFLEKIINVNGFKIPVFNIEHFKIISILEVTMVLTSKPIA